MIRKIIAAALLLVLAVSAAGTGRRKADRPCILGCAQRVLFFQYMAKKERTSARRTLLPAGGLSAGHSTKRKEKAGFMEDADR